MNRLPERSGGPGSLDRGRSSWTPGLAVGILLAGLGLSVLWISPLGGVLLLVAGGVGAACALRSGYPDGKAEAAGRKRFDPAAPDHNHIVVPPLSGRFPVSPGFDSSPRPHEHIRVVPGDWTQRQLNQLETMKQAGLIDRDEYRQRKEKILSRG